MPDNDELPHNDEIPPCIGEKMRDIAQGFGSRNAYLEYIQQNEVPHEQD